MDIRDITEEKIFGTLGKGVPMCDLLRSVESNTIRSMGSVETAIKKMPYTDDAQIAGLEVIHQRQKLNLEEIRTIKKNINCG